MSEHKSAHKDKLHDTQSLGKLNKDYSNLNRTCNQMYLKYSMISQLQGWELSCRPAILDID
jgi:hypothetical protein